MRVKASSQGLSVHAIAGTHAVLLAINYPKQSCRSLKGFAIHRTDLTENEAYWLQGMKVFEATDPRLAAGTRVSTRQHPIQDFSWADYSAKPGHRYAYRVLALKGEPEDLQPVAEAEVEVATESPAGGDHDIYFNRGVGASQEYARRFGNRKPGTEGGDEDPAWAWLSRGCFEAIIGFIARAKNSSWGLRVGAYELHLPGVVGALKAAADRGVDVRILHDADPKSPGPRNVQAFTDAGIDPATVTARKTSAISHNKVMVLLKSGRPVAVLTGSTNFSASGVFGHANAVHIVEDAAVARAYLKYLDQLCLNPVPAALKKALSLTPLPGTPPAAGTTTVFSPRSKADALDYYANLARSANDAVFMTFAFGMNDAFKEVYRDGAAGIRYALFEKLLGPGVREADRPAALEEMVSLRRMTENRFAVGARLVGNRLDGWLHEELTGLSRNVMYVHTKYMLIDPLGDDPIVVAGSANFSKASSDANDENMLVIRGNKRVADVYLTEFMRLWEHFAFREWAADAPSEALGAKRYLDVTDQWWHRHFGNTGLSRHREYFAG
jgi:phosphatidylserine/phosphatidylglycerophosphate/cardiolipin synthase-like enzyme